MVLHANLSSTQGCALKTNITLKIYLNYFEKRVCSERKRACQSALVASQLDHRRHLYNRARRSVPGPNAWSKRIVRPVAKRPVSRVFTAAKKHRPRLLRLEDYRPELGLLMAAVTKRLSGTAAACAPFIDLARFHRHFVRADLCDRRFRHLGFSLRRIIQHLCLLVWPPLPTDRRIRRRIPLYNPNMSRSIRPAAGACLARLIPLVSL
jgi:hypothetical protein